MPNYANKETRLMFDEEFNRLMLSKFFSKPNHKGFIALLYYSGVRVSEATNAKRKQFHREANMLYYDVGLRLKHSKQTPALPIPLRAPHVDCICNSYLGLEPEQIVFPYHRRTALDIVSRFHAYPHYYRQNRITRFFLDGYTIPEVKAWTGLNTKNLDYYVAMASIVKMGQSMGGAR